MLHNGLLGNICMPHANWITRHNDWIIYISLVLLFILCLAKWKTQNLGICSKCKFFLIFTSKFTLGKIALLNYHNMLKPWTYNYQLLSLSFIYLGFYVAFNTVQVISRRVVGRAEETSTYSSSGFCTVNCRPTASNYQLSHLRPCRE